MSERHNCGKNGWQICAACRGRIHLAGCTSKRKVAYDCCADRHWKLALDNQIIWGSPEKVMGLDDESIPMIGSHSTT